MIGTVPVCGGEVGCLGGRNGVSVCGRLWFWKVCSFARLNMPGELELQKQVSKP